MDQIETFDVGDKVKHPKFGQGTVTLRSGEGENQKVIVKFGAEFGEKKLAVRFAKMKKVQDRPTLVAAPSDVHAIPTGAAAAREKNAGDDEEEEELEADEELEGEEEDEEEE
jgi:ribosomal protein L12E/L44/L45/RPP1/RPP2